MPRRLAGRKTKGGSIRVTISVPAYLYNWVKQRIENGYYATFSEAVRQGLNLLRYERRTVYLGGED